MSYVVSQRMHELGVRLALSAEPRSVLRFVMAQGMRLTIGGLALGTAAALVLTRAMSNLLYGVRPADPLTVCAAAAALLAVSCLACYMPARRAMRVDAMAVLRYE